MYHCRVFTVQHTIGTPTFVYGFETLESATSYAKSVRRNNRHAIIVIRKGKRVCRVI
jgi:hypothetical protein